MAALKQYAITKIATLTGLDATTVAITSFGYTVPSGYRLVIVDVFVRCTAFTVGSKATDAVASVGGNSATYDDFQNSITIDIDALHDVVRLNTSGGSNNHVSYAAGADIRLSIETDSDATAETWAVDLFGYLVAA